MAGPRRSGREPLRPSAEFGKRALALLDTVGKTQQDLLKATSYDPKTLTRLAAGSGSLLSALAVKRVLKDWGADVSTLPSLDEAGIEPMEEWEREWMELGRQLHQLASDPRFQFEVDRIREVIRAHELVAEGTDKITRRKP